MALALILAPACLQDASFVVQVHNLTKAQQNLTIDFRVQGGTESAYHRSASIPRYQNLTIDEVSLSAATYVINATTGDLHVQKQASIGRTAWAVGFWISNGNLSVHVLRH